VHNESPSAARQLLAYDPQRPQYHFLPPANWMNDPNGLIHWQGEYHLFYQHNPERATWGPMHWGHAVSRDLVHWTDLPIALAPTPGGADADGCWSGCAVDHDGVPTLIYTGVREGRQRPCLATSDDGLRTWRKHPDNPVIAEPPAGLEVLGFRDHCVWREGATWYQVIGSGVRGMGGMILLYRSPDLVHWEYLGPACIGSEDETGEMWECPDLFPLGDQHVLLISPIPLGKTLYCIGTYADHHFTPHVRGDLDPGGHLYAPQTMRDAQGRRLMWGWLWEGRTREAQLAAGWAGVMSLPRVLTPRADGRLGMEPAPEIRALRGSHRRWEDIALSSTAVTPLRAVDGDALEIEVEFEPGDAAQFGLQVRCAPDGQEETRIFYDVATRFLGIDRTRSSLDRAATREVRGGVLALDPDTPLVLDVFLDHSVIEVYANGCFCLSSRVYPTRPDSQGVALFAQGGRAAARRIDVWQMATIW
jgi:beta-fructofuranosidase